MRLYALSVLISTLGLLFLATPSFAAIYINEVSPASDPEWVELYNDSNQDQNLEGWEVADEQTNQYHFGVTITQANQQTTIPAHGYLVVKGEVGTTTTDLSNTGEALFLYDSSNAQIDQRQYSPTSDPSKSDSRTPDGSNIWAITNSTQASSNPGPTPTPSPTPVSTPTPTPIPTAIPTPTKTPTPKPTPSPTKSPTPSPSATISLDSIAPSDSATVPTLTPDVLGEDSKVSPTPTTKKSSTLPLWFAGIGIILLTAAAILVGIKFSSF